MLRSASFCAVLTGLCGPLAGLAARSGTALDEVIVTSAENRAEDAQQIGIAVTVMSGDDLRAQHIQQPLILSALFFRPVDHEFDAPMGHHSFSLRNQTR